MNVFSKAARRIRYGQPIVIVSGLPRSGTSMAMRMLEAGGMPLLVDGLRSADISNPNGYYEFERVKELDKGEAPTWVPHARGKAVKVISFLLTWLPDGHDYRVIFMRRPLEEVLVSQNVMLARRGESVDPDADREARALYEEHLAQVARFLGRRAHFTVLDTDYADVVARPRDAAGRMADLIGRPLALDAMAAVADPTLYRNRHDRAAAL